MERSKVAQKVSQTADERAELMVELMAVSKAGMMDTVMVGL